MDKAKFLSGSHKRTLSGVVAEVSNLNENSIANKNYNFADILGDINYIGEDGQGSKGDDGEEMGLTKKQLAEKQKAIQIESPKTATPLPLKPAKQSSEAKPAAKSRLSKYMVLSDNGQELATSLSVNSKGEATSIISPAVKGGLATSTVQSNA